MDIYQKIKALNLPLQNIVVVGGSALECYGIRPSGDIDLLVTEDIYNDLKVNGWHEEIKPNGAKILSKDIFEVGTNFCYEDYQPKMGSLFETAITINGLKVINLDELKKYKSNLGREKDFKDIELINDFQKSSTLN